jgi:hypothetical protein
LSADEQGRGAMLVRVHAPGCPAYEIGDEIWQWALGDAIVDQAQIVADDTGADVLERPERRARIESVIAEMSAALVSVGDRYRSPDGVLYSLTDVSSEPDSGHRAGGLGAVNSPAPTVLEVMRFENVPLGSLASRRGGVRWSGGSEGEAVPGGHRGALGHLPSRAGYPRGRVLDHRCRWHRAGVN